MSYTVKRHDRAEQRKNDYKHIMKKKNILKYVYGGEWLDWHTDNETQLHRLSKDKIHCSCPLCTFKVKNIGFKHSDLIKLSKGENNFDIFLN
ncbi:MAG: hypothetical protein DBY41_06925 [Clostridium sp.]|nr:MAG: hypothetical protein DBY41_06925 [Clostridium sp.]